MNAEFWGSMVTYAVGILILQVNRGRLLMMTCVALYSYIVLNNNGIFLIGAWIAFMSSHNKLTPRTKVYHSSLDEAKTVQIQLFIVHIVGAVAFTVASIFKPGQDNFIYDYLTIPLYKIVKSTQVRYTSVSWHK